MFEEDDYRSILVADHDTSVVTGFEINEPVPPPAPEPEPEPAPEPVAAPEPEPTIKDLRARFYEAEPWHDVLTNGGKVSAAVARLQEKRVNRNLTIVADWMISLVANHLDDELALVVLLEQAEKVRTQIIWPERDAHQAALAAAAELTHETQHLERRPG